MEYLEELSQLWTIVRDSFRTELSDTVTDLFMGGLEVVGMTDNVLVMSADSNIRIRTVEAKYKADMEKKFSDYLGYDITIKFVCTQTPSSESFANRTGFQKTSSQISYDSPLPIRSRREYTPSLPDPTSPLITVADYEAMRRHEQEMEIEQDREEHIAAIGSTQPPFNFEYTFENYIVGNSNKFAHAACLAVADRPAQSYNPLFIYGPSGLGKTHLLYAITNELKRKNENIKVIYIKGEDFTNQMVDSLARQSMAEFRNKYRSCDVLLIDDIQFIAGKTSTQEEFFHTFNALYEDSKQIILTSDRPPREIKTLEDRLKTRFEWGLIADIQPPDLELRTAIIKKKADQVNVSIPDDVLSFLAENLRSNIRQIEGAIKKLGALSYLSGREITMEVARECISDLLGGEEPVAMTVDKIFALIYKKYNVKREDLVSAKRTKEIANARHLSVYLIRSITEMSLPNIGKIFNRDHSTMMSSLDIINKKITNDAIFKSEVDDLIKEIKGS
ncbi:MAG: chromosomal replication initiator protein DnaA [Clostridia bacterium]|nr:chromosomal replication initiator protein DnaA [Clostridia bacterium]